MTETPEEEAYRKHIERRDALRREGIPVGVGVPDHTTSRYHEERERREKEEMEEEINANTALNSMLSGESGYTGPYAPNEKAKIIDYINTMLPQKVLHIVDEKGNIVGKEVVEGEIPKDIMFNGGAFAYYSHNATMSNFDEKEIREQYDRLNIIITSTIGALKQGEFTPEMMAQYDGMEVQSMSRINSNKHGQERYLAAAEIHEENRRFGMGNRSSRLRNAWNRLKGTEE